MLEFQGRGVVEGVALAKVMTLVEDFDTPMKKYKKEENSLEWEKYAKAVEKASKQIEDLIALAEAANNKTQVEVMTAHLLMVTDVAIEESVKTYVEDGLSAPEALFKASDEMADMLSQIDDAYLQERSKDVLDVAKRIARILLGIDMVDLNQKKHILCGDDIEPSTVSKLDPKFTKAIVLGQGSTTSHAVIIAKTLDIPTVVGLKSDIEKFLNDQDVYVDGQSGKVIVEPDESVRAHFEEQAREWEHQKARYKAIKNEKAMTKDGVTIPLAINVGNPADAEKISEYGAEGVGLYRTEFIFMGRTKAPTEEEQYKAYESVVSKCHNKLCVIRTLDIGGDKPAEYLEIGQEANPFLGWRAIRISLDREDLFKTQVRAILRASASGKVALMLPMIISVDEIKAAKDLIDKVKADLNKEGIAYDDHMEVGIMIETPAAVIQAEKLAKYVDFFSVGTNDLTQYTLAVDRGNPKIAHLYDVCHPAVIGALNLTAKAAKAAGIWIGMCGEMAGEPLTLPLLIAMGFDELSMSAPSVPKIKDYMTKLTVDQRLLNDVLDLDNSQDIRSLLTHYQNNIKA